MQLVIRAHKLHTASPPQPITAQFGERGGSIGRADTNTLALPDPERHISRTQAQVLFAQGSFSIRNVGSGNPITVNGRPLKAGEDAPLAEGDEIVAGSYSLRASVNAASTVPAVAMRLPDDFDPFAQDAPATASEHAVDHSLDHALDHVSPRGAGLNTMFGLDRSPSSNHDPLAAFMSDAPARQAIAHVAAQPDHVPELHAAYSPPAVRMPAAAPRPAVAPPVHPPTAPHDDLWNAFCEGAGISPNTAHGLSPELMRQIGQLLQAAIGGTLRLVNARAVARQEMRAEATLIQARGNNPLKFSPDACAALEQMLQGSPAFMKGPAAMNDAMNDLLAHAVGTLAGTRAAMAGVLDCLGPDALAKRLGAAGPLDALLPARRDARLWRAFAAQHGRLREDAQEDFQRLFGKAFTQAYDEQAAQLQTH